MKKHLDDVYKHACLGGLMMGGAIVAFFDRTKVPHPWPWWLYVAVLAWALIQFWLAHHDYKAALDLYWKAKDGE